MIISESWLREWVSPDISTDALAELLTQAGLEVETITRQTLLGDKVVVGEITAIEKHPDADKLNICTVNIGTDEPLTIVCGASNARQGLVAPVALVGAVLPGDFKIGAREVRGIASHGMICAASEIGLEEQSSGLLALDANAHIGRLVDDHLALEDACIDIDLTPDRGDCLSIAGVARDIAALSKAPLTSLNITPVEATIDQTMRITLMAQDECPRYVGRIIKGINLKAQTPDFMKEKLRRVGLRSISPVVDVTNYVMMELGQPMHAFDLSKIEGEIVVRMANKDEQLTLLDARTITLQDDMLVIADKEKPIALAGIMGGANSEIDDVTTDILLESAYFAPTAIAGKARALSLQTDASHRYERGVDPALQAVAIERATQLLLEIVGGECGPVFDQSERASMPMVETIDFRPQRARDILGLAVADQTIKQHLTDLQMEVEDANVPWMVTRPSWRFDLTGEHDLVEEIGRLEGLDKIEPNPPALRAKPYTLAEQQVSPYALKGWLASRAYREVISYSFIAPEDQQTFVEVQNDKPTAVNLANPIASNMSQMRLSTLPGLLNTARNNEQRQHDRIRLFEMGHVFRADAESDTGAQEQEKLALLAGGEYRSVFWAGHGRKIDYYDVRGDIDSFFDRVGLASQIEYQENGTHPLLHPGQAADIILDGQVIGFIGTLHPQSQKHFDLNQTYVVAEITLSTLMRKAVTAFSSLSKFPETTRDIALLVKADVQSGHLLKEIRENSGNLLKKCELFDTYSGENIKDGYKSLAFSLCFQSETESLDSDFVDKLINDLLISLKAKFDANLRS